MLPRRAGASSGDRCRATCRRAVRSRGLRWLGRLETRFRARCHGRNTAHAPLLSNSATAGGRLDCPGGAVPRRYWNVKRCVPAACPCSAAIVRHARRVLRVQRWKRPVLPRRRRAQRLTEIGGRIFGSLNGSDCGPGCRDARGAAEADHVELVVAAALERTEPQDAVDQASNDRRTLFQVSLPVAGS